MKDFALFQARVFGAMRSKTIWFNAAMLGLLGHLPMILSELALLLPMIKPYLGENMYQNVLVFMAIGNLYLRVKTKTSLEAK